MKEIWNKTLIENTNCLNQKVTKIYKNNSVIKLCLSRTIFEEINTK